MSRALFVEVAFGALLLATLLYIPWIVLMRAVAIRQARGTMPIETARALLEKLSGGLLILGGANVLAAVPFVHPDAVIPAPIAGAELPVGLLAIAVAVAIRRLAPLSP